MSMKLKVLGLGLIAVLATSSFAVVNASAQLSGHFTSDTHHIILKGTDAYKTNHQLVFRETGAAEGISCTDSEYHGTVQLPSGGQTPTTTQAVTVTPSYTNCATESGTWGEVTVHHEASCATQVFKFTSGNPGTVHVECPVTITHPNCRIVVPKQTPSGGIVYHTIEEGGKHALTGTVAVTNITGHYEGGLCVFLGTKHTFEMNGNVTIWGEDTEKNRVNITAT